MDSNNAVHQHQLKSRWEVGKRKQDKESNGTLIDRHATQAKDRSKRAKVDIPIHQKVNKGIKQSRET